MFNMWLWGVLTPYIRRNVDSETAPGVHLNYSDIPKRFQPKVNNTQSYFYYLFTSQGVLISSITDIMQ